MRGRKDSRVLGEGEEVDMVTGALGVPGDYHIECVVMTTGAGPESGSSEPSCLPKSMGNGIPSLASLSPTQPTALLPASTSTNEDSRTKRNQSKEIIPVEATEHTSGVSLQP